MKTLHSLSRVALLIILALPMNSCFDVSPLENSDEIADPVFASGPSGGNYYSFADGVIDAAEQKLGVFLDNKETEGSLQNAEMLVSGNAYLGMVQEDIFRYARSTFIDQYESDPDSAEKKYIKIASQLRILMAAYSEDVFLLAKDSITSLAALDNAAYSVNLGPAGSGSCMTASMVMDANGIDACATTTLSYSEALDQIINDTGCDAMFMVISSPNRLLQSIASDAGVHLLRVTMPADMKYYDETGRIDADDYAFQDTDITGNMTVKSLVAAGPGFNNRVVHLFLDYIYGNTEEYRNFNDKWSEVSLTDSFYFMRDYPQLADYRAFCYVASAEPLQEEDLQPYFYTGEDGGSYSDMASELIYLLSKNLDIDFREENSTGSVENAIRMANGEASMAIVQDDLFDYYRNNNAMIDSLKVASMKKVIPLCYEYMHLLVRDTTGPASIAAFPNHNINLGPKTSGTFVTAINLVKSYDFDSSDNIIYSFDSPGDSVIKVNSGTYHAAFILSGLPYYRFYSHDTWQLSSELVNTHLVSPSFYNNDVPDTYAEDGAGVLVGNASTGEYPYSSILTTSTSLSTLRVRALLVVPPVYDDSKIDTFIKSIFRRAYYLTNPVDPDLWASYDIYFNGGDYNDDYTPDQLWLAVRKESVETYLDFDNDYGDCNELSDRGYYDTVMGAKEYFARNPFGWSDTAIRYYLSLFPEN